MSGGLEHLPIALAAVVLLLGARAAWNTAGAFERGSPIQRAWKLVSAWMLAWAFARVADLFGGDALTTTGELAGFAALIVALVLFVGEYRRAIAFFGEARSSGRSGIIVGAITVVMAVAYVALRVPEALTAMGDPHWMRLVDPLLDAMVIVLVGRLVVVTRPLYGGEVGHAWKVMLAGLATDIVGDVLFVCVPLSHRELVLALFGAVACTLCAYGAVLHRRVVRRANRD